MRRVFSSHAEVIRVWASRSQDEGRSGNINFRGDVIYSYDWYPIGRFVGDVVLIQSDNYSVSTTKHINFVSWATRTREKFYVPNLDPVDHAGNIDYFMAELKWRANRFWNSRQVTRSYDSYFRIFHQLKDYVKTFNLKLPAFAGYELLGEKAKKKIAEFKQRHWNGVIIPKWLFYKKQLEPKDLFKIKNAQVRAEFVKKVGIDRIIYHLGKVIDTVDNYQLVLLDLGDGRSRPFLKMENPSVPELWHVEGVHPVCQTVEDAIQYRHYGQLFVDVKSCRIDERWNFENEKYEVVKDYSKIVLPKWKPVKLT